MEEPPSFQRLSQKESIPFPGSRLYDVGSSKNESTRWLSWIKCDTELGRPAKPTMENISVIGLPTERLGEAARLLARCFYANPNF